ncbi:helix-turn-helix transcriptional regulator, partial [bacterium]|nr:helix-turn-helix transcriptional regulator [bacterium]
TKEMLDTFINALQLSIKTKIIGTTMDKDDAVTINFEKPSSGDSNLKIFLKIFDDGKWFNKETSFLIPNASKINWQVLETFLQITRMNRNNILKWAETNEAAMDVATRIGFKCAQVGVIGPAQAAKIVFDKVKERGLTIREIAEKTGLTQVSISNFKSGGDIKFSNLIKITNVLGFRIKIIS